MLVFLPSLFSQLEREFFLEESLPIKSCLLEIILSFALGQRVLAITTSPL